MSDRDAVALVGRNTYPFQVSVDHVEAMHVCQALRDVDQLNSTSSRHLWGRYQEVTYEFGAVYMFILPNELDNVPMFHPLRDHCEPAFTHRHSKQW
jgi:hypothetical protein